MDSSEQLAIVLENLGAEGINAFYVNLALEYGTVWVIIGLCIWGIRTFWKHNKDDF